MSTQLRKRLEVLETEWIHKTQMAQTKSDIKLVLDTLQTEMDTQTQKLSEQVEQALLMGTAQIAEHLIHEHPLQFERLLSIPIGSVSEGSPTNTPAAIWAAAGGLAGVTTGLLLSGSLTGTLLLALGTGGITAILLSPLAEGKDKASAAITESVEMAFNHMNTQLSAFHGTLEQECSRQIQDVLQRQLEEKRTHTRQNLVRKIQRMQDIQQRLENAKFDFWPSSTDVPRLT
jgi:hypothetical protein